MINPNTVEYTAPRAWVCAYRVSTAETACIQVEFFTNPTINT